VRYKHLESVSHCDNCASPVSDLSNYLVLFMGLKITSTEVLQASTVLSYTKGVSSCNKLIRRTYYAVDNLQKPLAYM